MRPSNKANIRTLNVAEDRSLLRGRLFPSATQESLDPGALDGMKCDEAGCATLRADHAAHAVGYGDGGRRLR